MKKPVRTDSSDALFQTHPRSFESNRYVYPVLSRRAGGISIGVNLNPDKICNFDCIYCQVERTEAGGKQFVELDRLEIELDRTVELVTSGRIYEGPCLSRTPAPLRRLNDIALSGDGEPTTFRNFDDVATVCADVRRRHDLGEVKLVLITNASMFHRPRVRRGLEILDDNGGEIWAKLDAGTEDYYKRVARSAIPFQRILDNLLSAARDRPIVIQSLFMRIQERPTESAEQEAYCRRLSEIVAAGGRIKLVQLYTVARVPAEDWVSPLAQSELEALGALVRSRTGLRVTVY